MEPSFARISVSKYGNHHQHPDGIGPHKLNMQGLKCTTISAVAPIGQNRPRLRIRMTQFPKVLNFNVRAKAQFLEQR